MSRVEVLKTYKLFIGGQFPRTESGRYYKLMNKKQDVLANMCLSSRKDVRNAVTAARKAQEGWSGKSAYNRSQILYRIAEMLEGRKAQFIEELVLQGESPKQAQTEVAMSIDRCIYYSGWCDKFQAWSSSVNPVSSSHFNFSVPEPMGVVVCIAPEHSGLLGLLSVILPAITGGNTVVVLASEHKPLSAITLAEVLATSDLPGGVINILTGKTSELVEHMASHMDVNAIIYARTDATEWQQIAYLSSLNVKRSFHWKENWFTSAAQNPYLIMDTQEVKTTWHPIEQIGVSGIKY
ncbi:MAG: aldehyde dehydrogenase family protein [Chitinophagaceae bacterium]|nr:aldehyde dehydrogenase family protein [Chitinophagaceae bacterium]